MWLIPILYFLFVGLMLLVNHQWDKMNRKYDKDIEMELTQNDKKSRHTLDK